MTSKPSRDPNTTLRRPPYTYFHLSLFTLASASNPSPLPRQAFQKQTTPLDAITALTYLQSALQQSFGLTGAAIPIDILKVSNDDTKQEIWTRVPYEDGGKVMAAVSAWSGTSDEKGVSLRVVGKGEWLGGLMGKERKLWVLGS